MVSCLTRIKHETSKAYFQGVLGTHDLTPFRRTSQPRVSNPRPFTYQASALPTELYGLTLGMISHIEYYGSLCNQMGNPLSHNRHEITFLREKVEGESYNDIPKASNYFFMKEVNVIFIFVISNGHLKLHEFRK